MVTKCRWCQKPLSAVPYEKNPAFGCAFNDPKVKGFCNIGCLDAWCDRDDRRKEERQKRRRY